MSLHYFLQGCYKFFLCVRDSSDIAHLMTDHVMLVAVDMTNNNTGLHRSSISSGISIIDLFVREEIGKCMRTIEGIIFVLHSAHGYNLFQLPLF